MLLCEGMDNSALVASSCAEEGGRGSVVLQGPEGLHLLLSVACAVVVCFSVRQQGYTPVLTLSVCT